ncbi:MAG: TetR/AcrR family transcriptional regulator [Candidatus Thorarchaeota archaeon]|nr:MAG: TetR/AcrR family transcriptional regulator [Candidatus Thorarchaeota archaeon]
MVETHGYLETTNKLIARRANVSVGLVYKYFPRGKVDILRQLILDSQEIYLTTEERQSPSLQVSLIDRPPSSKSLRLFIRQMLDFIINAHVSNAPFIRALEIAMLAEPSAFDDIIGWAQQVLNLKPILTELEKYDVVKESPSEKDLIIKTNIIDLVIHRYIFYAGHPFSSHDDFTDYLLELFIQLFRIDIPRNSKLV